MEATTVKRDVQEVHKELKDKLREYQEAGGVFIGLIQAGGDAEVHDTAVIGTMGQVAELLRDLREQIGDGNFHLALLVSARMDRPEEVVDKTEEFLGAEYLTEEEDD
jgi:alkanesulfonate monooxygenase SsuD/methylene tetrahydromethanopterin reductase-like flavin-dependent oxidoreductase (luciferase family)